MSAQLHLSTRIACSWSRLKCGRVSPIRFWLTGTAPSFGALR
jgi:hypothetical protein